MIVRCISNSGENLLQATADLGYTKEAKFSFEIGAIYTVYGISCIDNLWSYLFSKEENENPLWWPAELFEVIDHKLPPFFYSDIRVKDNYKGEKNIMAIFGYKEMALNDNHYDYLNERYTEELDIFFKRKKEIDEFQDMQNKN